MIANKDGIDDTDQEFRVELNNGHGYILIASNNPMVSYLYEGLFEYGFGHNGVELWLFRWWHR